MKAYDIIKIWRKDSSPAFRIMITTEQIQQLIDEGKTTFTLEEITRTMAYREELRAEHSAILDTPKAKRTADQSFDRMCELGNLITHFDFVVDKLLGGTQWKRYERNTKLVLQPIDA